MMTIGQPNPNLDPVDRDALQACIDIARCDPERADQIAHKLQHDTWDEAATFACYAVQMDSLGLKPWQSPICYIDENNPNPNEWDKAGQVLLRKMLRAGISRYDPDPLAALAARARRRSKPPSG
jgi:hypothetical protein